MKTRMKMAWMRGVAGVTGAMVSVGAMIALNACNSADSRTSGRSENRAVIDAPNAGFEQGEIAARRVPNAAPAPAPASAAFSPQVSPGASPMSNEPLWWARSQSSGEATTKGNSMALDGATGDECVTGFQTRRSKIDFQQVPQIDLNNVLESNRKGGGQSPFHNGAPAQVVAPGAMEVMLDPGQELLVIERPQVWGGDRYGRPDTDDVPGSGTLMCRWGEPGQEAREVPVPLKHTDVHAAISGPISSVRVTQEFHNPYGSKIEAVYVFPLPEDAAVNDFVMTIGSKSVRGVIREREQAEQIYAQAKAQGYHASLMTQERSNIFTQKVANIEPGERVDVTVTYFGALGFRESGYEFVFPMVVGPRYNPASTLMSGEGIGATAAFANGGGGGGGQGTNIGYLRPRERCGRDVSISVDINAGVRLEQVESPTHQVSVRTGADGSTARVQLSAMDTIPNRDFVLRYRVAGGQVKAGMIASHDQRSGDDYFAMVLVPPSDLRYCPRGPVEMVFVVDCSGSMDGMPLELAKRCVSNAMGMLRSGDTFQVIRFSDKATFLTSSPIAVNPENMQRAERDVMGLVTGGGTELLNGLEPALEMRGDWKRSRVVCVLSDGFLGNEPEVLGQLKRKLGDSRVFAVGIGSAPNRALMQGIARLGRGCAATVGSVQDADDAMRLLMERVTNAAMTDLRLDFGSMDAKDVYPKRLPDLYVGRPILVTGKLRGRSGMGGVVRVSGRVGTERQEVEAPVLWSDPEQSRAVPLMWARAKITELDEEGRWGRAAGAGSTRGPNKGEITDVSLKYGVMSAYTSFVAVDCATRTGGSYGTTVSVPVPVPPGTRYETTVGGR